MGQLLQIVTILLQNVAVITKGNVRDAVERRILNDLIAFLKR